MIFIKFKTDIKGYDEFTKNYIYGYYENIIQYIETEQTERLLLNDKNYYFQYIKIYF